MDQNLAKALCEALGEALGDELGLALGLALGEALGLTLGEALGNSTRFQKRSRQQVGQHHRRIRTMVKVLKRLVDTRDRGLVGRRSSQHDGE